MSITLRTWILKSKINCFPWRIWKGELSMLPVSSRTLFSNRGIGIDILERELKESGYLFPDEILLEVLKDSEALKRRRGFSNVEEDTSFGLLPDYLTEEDFDDETVPF